MQKKYFREIQASYPYRVSSKSCILHLQIIPQLEHNFSAGSLERVSSLTNQKSAKEHKFPAYKGTRGVIWSKNFTNKPLK